MTKKLSASARIVSAASKLDANDRDILHRWLSDDRTHVIVDGEKHQPARYVERQSVFAGLSDSDPIDDVLTYFAKHKTKIRAIFADLDAEAVEQKLVEDAIKESALQKLKAAQKATARAEELKRERREREQQEFLTSQAAARREAKEREEKAAIAEERARETLSPPALTEVPAASPIPKDSEFMDFADIRIKSRRERNLDILLLGVSGLLGYVDADNLRDGDPALFNIVNKVCSDYRWGKRILIDLDWQSEGIRDPSRAIFDKVVLPKLDEKRKARAGAGVARTGDPMLEGIASTSENLSFSVHDFLIANTQRDYTYNQIADEIGVDWQAVSKECRRLVADQESGVVRATRKTSRGTSEVYRYAPQRKQIETGATTSDAVIKQVLLRLIGGYPAQSLRQLADMTRRELMTMADHSFRSALADLIASKKVIVKPGLRRANLHFLPSETSVAECGEVWRGE